MYIEEKILIENGNVDNEAELDGEESLVAALADNDGGYPMYNIKVERGFYTVYELKRKYDIKNKRIILDSDFQRESVWKPWSYVKKKYKLNVTNFLCSERSLTCYFYCILLDVFKILFLIFIWRQISTTV